MVLGMLILCGCHGLHHRALGHRILHALHDSHPHVRHHMLHHYRLHSPHLFAHLFALGDELVDDGGHGVRLLASGRGIHPRDESIDGGERPSPSSWPSSPCDGPSWILPSGFRPSCPACPAFPSSARPEASAPAPTGSRHRRKKRGGRGSFYLPSWKTLLFSLCFILES